MGAQAYPLTCITLCNLQMPVETVLNDFLVTLTHVQRNRSYSSDCSIVFFFLFLSGCGRHDAVHQWLVDIDGGR